MTPWVRESLSDVVRDFTSRKNRPWVLAAIGCVLVVSAWKLKLGEPRPDYTHRRGPDTIAYHYEQWLHERRYLWFGKSGKGLNLTTVNWYLDGRPTPRQRMQAAQEHEVALLRLGYFEERHFDWPGGDINKFWNAFGQRARQTELQNNYSASWTMQGGTNVAIIARKDDMPIIDSLLKQLIPSVTNQPPTKGN